jgi:DNA (cytosine-5)-methyltransferase 1
MEIKYIDLFCGIGGFRYASEQSFKDNSINSTCVFSSDIDKYSREAYYANFGEYPAGDITKINEKQIPDHDVLYAGFPCQPFSIIGNKKGFDDTGGTLFFDIARILSEKKPKAFILENVKMLVGHDKGRTLKTILRVLRELGYSVEYRVLNALNYGLPQKRERVIILGYYKPILFQWPIPSLERPSLKELLEEEVDEKFYVSDRIKNKRLNSHKSEHEVSIWHENKAGHISSYDFSCALRAGASHNYLLVDGIRRLTPREMLRLQGFPESFKIVVSDAQTRKQAGNAVPVNMIKGVIDSFLPFWIEDFSKYELILEEMEMPLAMQG